MEYSNYIRGASTVFDRNLNDDNFFDFFISPNFVHVVCSHETRKIIKTDTFLYSINMITASVFFSKCNQLAAVHCTTNSGRSFEKKKTKEADCQSDKNTKIRKIGEYASFLQINTHTHNSQQLHPKKKRDAIQIPLEEFLFIRQTVISKKHQSIGDKKMNKSVPDAPESHTHTHTMGNAKRRRGRQL